MRKFENYAAALDVLSRASEQDLDNEFVQSGIIDKFSLQFVTLASELSVMLGS